MERMGVCVWGGVAGSKDPGQLVGGSCVYRKAAVGPSMCLRGTLGESASVRWGEDVLLSEGLGHCTGEAPGLLRTERCCPSAAATTRPLSWHIMSPLYCLL